MLVAHRKISFFAPSMGGGGAERVMLDLAIEFARLGYPVDLVLVSAEGPYLSCIPEKIRVIDLGASRTLKSLPSLIRYLRKNRPLTMMSTIDNANIVLVWASVLAQTQVRIVLREAAVAPWSPPGSTTTLKMHLYRRLKRYTYLLADKIVAVSKGVSGNLQSLLGIPDDAIEVIYNPVDSLRLFRRAQEKIDHRWFRDDSVPVILAVGRLTKQKDYFTLLHAFAQVRQTTKANLLVLGEGEERKALEAEVEKLGLSSDVELPGFVDNPFPFMAKAALLVLSSTFEGLPNVLIQALSLGTPVVSTNCDSGPDEILKSGEYGLLVAVGDKAALAEGILKELEAKKLEEKKKLLVERARYFSMERAFAAYKEVLLPDDT